MKGSFEVQSVEETWRLAAELARELKPGDVLCLEGELGAGKTTFTQGLAHALGVIRRDVFGIACDPNEAAAVALYHDSSEILTGDLPTPIKYHSRAISSAY